MRINIKIRSPLTCTKDKRNFSYVINETDSLRDVLILLGYDERHIPTIMAKVNNSIKPLNYMPEGNDSIEFFVLLGGG